MKPLLVRFVIYRLEGNIALRRGLDLGYKYAHEFNHERDDKFNLSGVLATLNLSYKV